VVTCLPEWENGRSLNGDMKQRARRGRFYKRCSFLLIVDKHHGLYCKNKNKEILYVTVLCTIHAHHPFLEPAAAARQCCSGISGSDGPASVTGRHNAGNTQSAKRKLPPHRRQWPPRPGWAGHQRYRPVACYTARAG